jgi:hypothetical protein
MPARRNCALSLSSRGLNGSSQMARRTLTVEAIAIQPNKQVRVKSNPYAKAIIILKVLI